MRSIHLMLVDDHAVLRAGLKSLLNAYEDMEVVAEANNGHEALARVEAASPDVVLMDISMPDVDGLEATRRLKAQDPRCRVLVLTVHAEKQYFFRMLDAGASGYLTKRAAAEELVAAIRAVAAGHVYLQTALARWLLEGYQRLDASQKADEAREQATRPDAATLESLSPRERQVLELVAEGLTNAEIGARLDISPKTVARHRERVMKKLNLHSRTELVKFAIRTGLVEL